MDLIVERIAAYADLDTRINIMLTSQIQYARLAYSSEAWNHVTLRDKRLDIKSLALPRNAYLVRVLVLERCILMCNVLSRIYEFFPRLEQLQVCECQIDNGNDSDNDGEMEHPPTAVSNNKILNVYFYPSELPRDFLDLFPLGTLFDAFPCSQSRCSFWVPICEYTNNSITYNTAPSESCKVCNSEIHMHKLCKTCSARLRCSICQTVVCEDCRAHELLRLCYDCGLLCTQCAKDRGRQCIFCRSMYCIVHASSAGAHRGFCEWCTYGGFRTSELHSS